MTPLAEATLERPITDDELTELALSADPDEQLDHDAVAWSGSDDDTEFPELLPSWYMPTPSMRSRKRWHKAVVIGLIVAFAIINILGCCITYGHLVVA